MRLDPYRQWAKLLAKAILPMLLLVLDTGAAAPRPQAISLRIDATDIARKLIHSEMDIPVTPGTLTLVFPKWIPGEHAPSGPLNNVVWMKFSVGGQPVAWTRDSVDMFAFHLRIPTGAQKLEVALDYALRPDEATPLPAASFLERSVALSEGGEHGRHPNSGEHLVCRRAGSVPVPCPARDWPTGLFNSLSPP